MLATSDRTPDSPDSMLASSDLTGLQRQRTPLTSANDLLLVDAEVSEAMTAVTSCDHRRVDIESERG
jgi:hypothetical protein